VKGKLANGVCSQYSPHYLRTCIQHYQGADKSLARPTSRYILFDDENISFDASLVIYISSTNIPPIVIINRI
jgi:homoserine trans-succinylase